MPVVLLDFEADEDGNVEQCAHYHWGKSPNYYGDDEELLASTVTVNTSGTYTGSTVTSTISAPFRFTGNWDSSVPAADIFRANGYTYYLWPNGTISTPTDSQVGSLAVLSESDGGEVRFGDYSLELNYDYASYDGSANANFYVRYCGNPIYIDGTPSELGVWVYADSQSYGYTLYGQIAVWSGSDYTTKYYVLRHDSDGDGDIDSDDNGYIDWEGWMYVCADISDCAAYYSEEHPYLIEPGNGILWLCYQPASGRSGRYAGTIYFDNFRVSYGTDLDDLTNPVITSITANDVELLNTDEAPTIDTNTIEVNAYYEDPESANRSGIDASAVTIEIDGEVISSDNSDSQATIRLDLNNGLHSIKVTTYDVFGNYYSETCYLNVNSAEEETVSATLTGADTVTMGTDYVLTLASIGAVQTIEMTVVQINSDFGEPTVVFSDGWEGEVVYTSTGFKKAMMTVSATYTGGDIPSDAIIATFSFDVPNTLDQETDFFTYQVSNITCVDAEGNVTTSAQEKVKLSLSAYYTLKAGTSVSGLDTTLTVTTEDGLPAEGVTIYVNGEEAGTTDENGEFQTNVSVNLSGGDTFTAYAVDANGRSSFTTTVTVMNSTSDAAPTALSLNASENPNTTQNITWMAGLDANQEATVRYSESLNDDGSLASPITVTGSTTLHSFTTDKNAAYLNSVTLTGLTPATTYYYQVGDNSDTEENWSAVSYFTTDGGENGATNFFVLGDTQMTGDESSDATEIGYLTTIATAVAGMDFGLQTGDYIDNGGNYTMWAEMQNVFSSEFTGIDIIHTLGNHEYYGDSTGSAASILLSLGSAEYYSVEYGDVYIAVIHNSASMSEALEWLISDAQASSATWKVLSIHEPIFYTNANSASQYYITVPDAVAEAGIDVVFSGHDHSYARNVDEESGAVYFICGDLGEKSRNVNYAATDNGFDFDFISQDYTALYLTVTAETADSGNDCSMTITAKDYDGTVIDSYTITKQGTCTDGHTWESYDRDTGNLICSVCGTTTPAVGEYYTGLISDYATGNLLYLVGGIPRTGHQYISGLHYYFDENGFAYDGAYVLCGEQCLFAEGQYVSCSTADVLLAGLAGTNVNFVFYSDGRLVLEGSGATDSYSTSGYSPWYTYRHSIKSITIGAGITKIGTYAFSGAINCVSITFAEDSNLTTINGSAFYYMSSLTEITLPNTVTSIGNYAFGYGKSLTNVYLPDGVSSINATAFNYCSSDLILSVGYDSYAKDWAETNGISYVEREQTDAPLASGDCGENITWTLSTDGVLTLTGSGAMTSYSGSKSNVPWYNYRAAIKSIVIDPAITELSTYAFYGATNCTSVSFGDDSQLTKIGGSAFYYMSSLTEITLPEKVVSIGNYAFGYGKSLTNVYLPDGVSSINATAFNYCSSDLILSVGYDSYAKDWAETNGIAYIVRNSDTENQTDDIDAVTDGKAVAEETETDGTAENSITPYDVEDVEETEKPEDIVDMENPENAADVADAEDTENHLSTEQLEEIEGGESQISMVAEGLCGDNAAWILTSDGFLSIYGYGEMEEYNMDENPAPWNEYSEQILSIKLGEGITTIGAYAFFNLSSLVTVEFPEDSALTFIQDYAFAECESLKEIALPSNLEIIGEASFANCTSLEYIEIPESINEIGMRTVDYQTFEDSVIPATCATFDGCELLKVKAPSGSYAASYAVENGLTLIE